MDAKRLLDIAVSSVLFLLCIPILLPLLFLIFIYDRKSPLYISPRVGQRGKLFRIIKLRTMIKDADRSGVDSTAANDPRITPVGHFLRRYKLDELPQFWNVLIGDMSLVGPRPNVKRETDIYTEVEKELLSVRPGITDLSSIVFSDENEILRGSHDADIAYNQLIRPWKSRLGLLYVRHQSLWLDLNLLFLTPVAIFNRAFVLERVEKLLKGMTDDQKLIAVAGRRETLAPFPPPGANRIVTSRA